MKNMKTLLAVIMALCLVMSLSIPVMATTVDTTPTTSAASEPTGTSENTNPTENAATEPAEEHVHEDEETEAPVEDETETETEVHDHDHDHEETAPEAGWKKPVRIVLTVLEVIACVALAVIVLMQSGKESGLSGAISGNTDSYMSKSGRGGLDKMLAKSTKWVALVWLLLTLALSLI